MKKVTLLQGLIGVAVTAALIYSYAYMAGKGWKNSQDK